jgi:Putative transposase
MEKLCRYIARSALATSRLSVTSTGQVLYKLKRPFRDSTHSVLMDPVLSEN